MRRKNKQLRGSGAQARDNTESPLFDKNFALQKENQKLKRRIREIGTESHERLEQVLEAQADRDCLREELQEQAQKRRNHE